MVSTFKAYFTSLNRVTIEASAHLVSYKAITIKPKGYLLVRYGQYVQGDNGR